MSGFLNPFIFAAAPSGYNYFTFVLLDNGGGTQVLFPGVRITTVGGVEHPPSSMTSNTAPSPYIASTTTSYNQPYQAFRAANNSPANGTRSGDVTLYVGTTALIPVSFRIEKATQAANAVVKDLDFYGHITLGGTRTLLKSVRGLVWTSSAASQTITI